MEIADGYDPNRDIWIPELRRNLFWKIKQWGEERSWFFGRGYSNYFTKGERLFKGMKGLIKDWKHFTTFMKTWIGFYIRTFKDQKDLAELLSTVQLSILFQKDSQIPQSLLKKSLKLSSLLIKARPLGEEPSILISYPYWGGVSSPHPCIHLIILCTSVGFLPVGRIYLTTLLIYFNWSNSMEVFSI